MSRNEDAYPRECVEAEQLVRSAIMRIINEMPDAGERERRMEFIAAAWEDITSP